MLDRKVVCRNCGIVLQEGIEPAKEVKCIDCEVAEQLEFVLITHPEVAEDE
jgi:hypothetical protein